MTTTDRAQHLANIINAIKVGPCAVGATVEGSSVLVGGGHRVDFGATGAKISGPNKGMQAQIVRGFLGVQVQLMPR